MAISHWPVIVVGAGAAGLAAALFAARRGARVLLLETRPTPGAKLRVSGGGRCNVLPSEMRLERFHTDGSRPAMRNVLTSWPLEAVRGWFEEDLGVPLKVEATGKVFPTSDRSRDVVEALLAACARSGVVLDGGHRVVQIECASQPEGARFELRCANGRQLTCRHLVLTTGGLSLPKSGSDGRGLEIARVLGHTIVPTYPALVPLLTDEARWKALAGVSMRVRLRALEGTRCLEEREGDFLFTHRGFSGPATLDMSRHVCGPDGGGKRLVVEWAPQADWEKLLQSPGRRSVAGLLREHLPARVAGVLVELAGIPAEAAHRVAELGRDARLALLRHLTAYELPVSGNEGYATAEVTGGGVALEEVSHRTLESRRVPGLYLAGEMLDVVGHIGGYNFLWAWTSGRKVGLSLPVDDGELPS